MRLLSASIAATAVITAVRAAIKPHGGKETRNAFASFESLVDKAAVSAREPDLEHDREASSSFPVTRWPTSFLPAMISERSE
jgi:hypothetical protein